MCYAYGINKGDTDMHKATRIHKGKYHYRGHEVEEVGRYGCGYGGAAWNIRHLSEEWAHDTSNTLSDAKWLIDQWLDK